MIRGFALSTPRRAARAALLSLLLCLLPWTTARGQLSSPDPLRCVLVIIHDHVPDRIWIVAPEYLTEAAGPGQFVAAAFGLEGGHLQVPMAAVAMLAGTEDPIPEIGMFVENASVAGHFSALDPSLAWTGFLAPVIAPLPGGIPVDMHFDLQSAPNPGYTDYAGLAAQVLGSALGVGPSDPGGNPLPPGYQIRFPTDAVIQGVSALPSTSDVWLAPPFPNPTRGPVSLSLGLIPDTPYTLGIYDLRGRRVAEWLGTAPGARVVMSWDALGVGRLAAGTYLVRLRQAGEASVQRLVRLP